MSNLRNKHLKIPNVLLTNADKALLKINKIINEAISAIGETAVPQPRNSCFQVYNRYLGQFEVKKSVPASLEQNDSTIIPLIKKTLLSEKNTL